MVHIFFIPITEKSGTISLNLLSLIGSQILRLPIIKVSYIHYLLIWEHPRS